MHYFKYLKWDTVQQLEDSIPLCSVLYEHRINTSRHLCVWEITVQGTDWRYFIILLRPNWQWCWTLKEKFITYVTPTVPMCSYHHVCCSVLNLTWSCIWRKKPPYVITKTIAPSTILAAGWTLGLSGLWDSAQSFPAKTGEGCNQRRLFNVDLAILVK